MPVGIRIQLNDKLYLRDPQDTKLGRKIIKHGILLLDEIGLESFNFKKLALRIESTEASVYRYFENKHLLLTYLVSWYWEWLLYQIDLQTSHLPDPAEKLKQVIRIIVESSRANTSIEFIDQEVLHRLVVAEGVKAYHTKEVDKENTSGFFLNYKAMAERVAGFISEINPDFPYPRSLASNMFEMANNQIYFSEHLPRLTDIRLKKNGLSPVIDLLEYFVFKLIKP
ncbi:MAG: TetR/AcrR family transcriptional regulator [Saprospiraceae bacterium]|jgi:AcrR family transcriptional regulator